ncbi:DUF5365 family protein [Bacillus sp. NPDC077027]|uniref:DUF5365 family protein n=1 Tax=Bacillus sp. NPDC077027 TaxID=3390548 RepID=UPI003CFEB332
MKAATELQEQAIEEISADFYQILSHYLYEYELAELKQKRILTFVDGTYNGTMDDAFRILSGLQLLHTIISKPRRQITKRDRELFEQNRQQINECGYSFPFRLDDFEKQQLQNA